MIHWVVHWVIQWVIHWMTHLMTHWRFLLSIHPLPSHPQRTIQVRFPVPRVADTAESQSQIVPAGWDTYYNLISGVEEKNIGGNAVNITEGHNFRIYTSFVPDYNN